MKKENFYSEIDNIVLNIIKKHPDFYFLMKSKKGIHPLDLKKSLFRLYKEKKITSVLYKNIKESAKDKGKFSVENNNLLPVPHLLDYDWRFSKTGNDKMYSLVNKYLNGGNKTVVFIGTPSLFKMYFTKGYNKNTFILIDKNADKHINYITRCSHNFSYIQYDIMNMEPLDIHADIVIMDPPWYLNYNKLFFQFANSLLVNGGKIICVLPPKYTKENVEEEYIALKAFINNLGIEQIKYYRNYVLYDTPPFEVNVLKVNGIYCMPKEWRTGDVMVSSKTTNHTIKCTRINIKENHWDEIDVGLVRYKLKTGQDLIIKNFDLSIEKLYNNDIYPSVKRSNTSKEKTINIWTSGNRVFFCNNIPLLYYILLEYSIHHNYYKSDICNKIETFFDVTLSPEQHSNILDCIEFIEKTNEIEEKEYGKWVNFND